MKVYLSRVAFTSLLSLVVFLCCEFYIRQQVTSVEDLSRSKAGFHLERDPRFLYEFTPNGPRLIPKRDVLIHNHFVSGQDVEVSTNSLGFRDTEIEPTPHDKELRILALGDSITISDYLPRARIFTEIVEGYLQKHFDNQEFSVVNAGVGDIGLREEIDILEERGLQIRPKIVLLNFYLNDSRPSWGFNDEFAHRSWIRRNSLFINAIYHQLKLWGWTKDKGGDRFEWISLKEKINWKSSNQAFMQLVAAASYDWGSAWKENTWQELSHQFDRLDHLAITHSFKVYLVAFPVSFQVYADDPHSQPQERLKEISIKRNYPFLDLLPVFRKNNTEELFFDQCHLNERGHAITAEAMSAFIKRNN